MRLLRWFAREDAAADYECVTIAQKITNGISCIDIVAFSVAPNTTTVRRSAYQVLRNISGNLAMFAAILLASSFDSNFAAERRPGSSS